MTHGLDLLAALKSAGVALIDGGGSTIASVGTAIASGGTDSISVGIGDSVVVEDTNGTGKGGEDENNGGEGAKEHLGSSS